MNQAFLMRLDERLNDSNRAANDGLLVQWYRCLRTIYRIIHHKLKEAEMLLDKKIKKEDCDRYKLEKLFTKAKNSFSGTVSRDLQQMNLQKNEEVLDEIDTKLNDLIIEHGLIKLTRQGYTKGSGIKEKFK